MMQQRKQEVDDAVFGARVFYYVFHFLGILIMIVYDCEIQQDLKNYKLGYPLFLLIIFLISAYFFMTCGKNPGYAEASPPESFKSVSDVQVQSPDRFRHHHDQQDDLTYINDHQNQKLFQKLQKSGSEQQQQSLDIELQNYNKNSDNFGKIDEINDNILSKSQNNNNNYKEINLTDTNLQQVDLENLTNNGQQIQSQQQQQQSDLKKQSQIQDQDNEYEEDVKRFFCPKCNLRQKYRTKHCDLCGRCIFKYDHHCFWIGGCVGELNHRSFWAFLLFQCIFVTLAFKIFWDGMDNYSKRNAETGEWVHENAYGAFAVFAFISFLFILFTGILWVYHTFLILTNQSTWEHASRNKITYTQRYPKGFYPFDKGFIQNIKVVFMHNNETQNWQLPTLKHAQFKAQNSFNICENQYYSCC